MWGAMGRVCFGGLVGAACATVEEVRANWRRVMMGWLPLAGALVGCSPAPPEGALPPSDPQRCVAPEELDGEAVPARELALGEGDPTTFEPYSEGETVALQLGWQGGFMITPRLRVQALPGDPDSNCWQLRLNNEMDDPAAEVAPGVVAQLLFERHGDV